MLAQIATLVSALAASVAAHPAATEIATRQTITDTAKGLSWGAYFANKNWQSSYIRGPDGYVQWTGHWDAFANSDYVSGLPGFAVSCSATFNDNNAAVGAWSLCSGFPGNATVEAQFIEPGFNWLASIRHNVTKDGKTTVVISSGDPPVGGSLFEHTVQSVEIVG
ncbi:hypothetical protein ONZ43_g3659 [Nemania bipapillata]|uniref:Uncharacterized protein n=1 Tax=Nemania bipapillata TaxID=110536 RepID=A0ACC2IVX2_9PEZI|nr:hypothetical protein ONZ43_g3659 [Nemania bipapillata]